MRSKLPTYFSITDLEENNSVSNDSNYLSQLKELLVNGCMRKRIVVMCIQWITVVLSYNGLTLNSVNLVRSLKTQLPT